MLPLLAPSNSRPRPTLKFMRFHGKLTEEAGNILIKGTSLEGDRESEEQRSEDRARRMDLAKLRKGNVVEAGPKI